MRQSSWPRPGDHHEAMYGGKGCAAVAERIAGQRAVVGRAATAEKQGQVPVKPITCSVAPLRTARRHPSTMDAWLSSSEKMAVFALPHSAEMVPRFAAKPVGKSRQASVPAQHRMIATATFPHVTIEIH